MDILRFITAGSVDDGKSTLIGRLLYDSKSILADHLEAIEQQSRNKEQGEIDLALLTDGLRAEREQGITIDVAYKYFATPQRKFIIADAPGHIQYTRNMITGASNADLIIILVDARHGISEQTRRHSIIAGLLKIPQVVVAINKLDLVNYSQEVYETIRSAYAELAQTLGLQQVTYIPISALTGDNVVEKSENTPWYEGPALLDWLEQVPVQQHRELELQRLPVQYVVRPQTEALHDYRGYAGRIASGIYRRGEQVTVLPSGLNTTIKTIERNGVEVEEAFAHQSVIVQLEDDVDISRGDVIVGHDQVPQVSQELEAVVAWMDTRPLTPGARYKLQLNSTVLPAIVKELVHRVDVHTLAQQPSPDALQLNEIALVRIKTATPLVFDAYDTLRGNGGAILIDETSHVTVGAVLLQQNSPF